MFLYYLIAILSINGINDKYKKNTNIHWYITCDFIYVVQINLNNMSLKKFSRVRQVLLFINELSSKLGTYSNLERVSTQNVVILSTIGKLCRPKFQVVPIVFLSCRIELIFPQFKILVFFGISQVQPRLLICGKLNTNNFMSCNKQFTPQRSRGGGYNVLLPTYFNLWCSFLHVGVPNTKIPRKKTEYFYRHPPNLF